MTDRIEPGTTWFVYILRCSDGSLYTGITNNLNRRINEHNDRSKSSRAAKYTRSRQPVSLVYSETTENRATSSQREYQIKQLSRTQKLQLCSN